MNLNPDNSNSNSNSNSNNDDWCENFNDDRDDVLISSTSSSSSLSISLLPLPIPTPTQIEKSSVGENLYIELPAQLHPACSLGVRRVSSCYFSLGSNHESMTDLLSQLGDNNTNTISRYDISKKESIDNDSVEDIFSHDIIMQVFTYLDAHSLKRFSETARRPNFEAFYFLQLQLQQALLVQNNDNIADTDTIVINNDNNNNNLNRRHNNNNANTNDYHSLSTTIEDSTSILSRVAKENMTKAKEIIQQYQNSNTTLRNMPLSYSLAYVRHYLSHNGLHAMFSNSNNVNASSQTLASAAIFISVVGAASLVSSSDIPITLMTDMIDTSFGSELPNVLFRVGFVGSLVKVARKISDTEQGLAVREKAEQMARSMQELPAALMTTKTTTRREEGQQQQQQQYSQLTQSLPVQKGLDEGNQNSQSHSQQRSNFMIPSLFEMRHMMQEMMSNLAVKQERPSILFDPYDNLPSSKDKDDNNDMESKERDQEEKKKYESDDQELSRPHTTTTMNDNIVDRKIPSGCVGAYYIAIHEAANHITEQIKESRRSKFQALSTEYQRERSIEFLAACTSNDSLDRVKEMISIMDVNRFFVGHDGTETCALHTAAFNGADKVVDFLCMGIHHQKSQLDGGICDFNSRDSNGWTALHFAAGANSILAVQVLAQHGAALDVEAQNGYSPLQWAVRLSNEEVAEELRALIIKVDIDHGSWISSQPLASIANRFLSLIPTQ